MNIIPEKYRTSDGLEFDDSVEAKRHEDVHLAYQDFLDAHDKLGKVLACAQKTADGEVFKLDSFKTYWYVDVGWRGEPRMDKVFFLGYNFRWRAERDDVVLIITSGDEKEEFAIGELYASKRAAQLALVERQDNWLREQASIIAEWRQETFDTSQDQ